MVRELPLLGADKEKGMKLTLLLTGIGLITISVVCVWAAAFQPAFTLLTAGLAAIGASVLMKDPE